MTRTARVTMRDPSLPHQIVLTFAGNDIAVSCNCLRGGVLETRTSFPADEALAVYRAHLDEAVAS